MKQNTGSYSTVLANEDKPAAALYRDRVILDAVFVWSHDLADDSQPHLFWTNWVAQTPIQFILEIGSLIFRKVLKLSRVSWNT